MQTEYTAQELARFWEKVDKDGPIPAHCPELGPCWVWTAAPSPNGYGHTQIRGKGGGAHRFAYILTYGPIPDDLKVCHSCDNRLCVNPAHLFLGTHQDNMDDMRAKGRAASGDKNAMRLYPAMVPRGDAHYKRINPERAIRGEAIGASKLVADDVLEIRRSYDAREESQTELARRFNVTQSAIWYVVHRKSWAHLP